MQFTPSMFFFTRDAIKLCVDPGAGKDLEWVGGGSDVASFLRTDNMDAKAPMPVSRIAP